MLGSGPMPTAWALATVVQLLVLQTPVTDVPRALAALYDKLPQQSDHGEPVVTVGIVTGADDVEVRANRALVATWADADGAHRRVLPAPVRLIARMQTSHAAQMRYLVPLTDDRPLGAPEPSSLLQHWALLGTAAFWQPTGALWPLFAVPLDLRRVRLVAPAPDVTSAAALFERLADSDPQVQAPEVQRLSHPRGVLHVEVPTGPGALSLVARAQDIVTLEPADGADDGAVMEVAQVAYGTGYPWAGRQNRNFRGKLHLTVAPDGTLCVVNALPLETYLRGVVPAEMPPAAPEEALMAQAIAARSYVLQTMGHAHRDGPYHFCAEQHCQVYAGSLAEDARTDAAVRRTEGSVLMDGGHVVRALFSADCGGRTENNDVPWPQAPDARLRSVADGWGQSHATWQHPEALQRDLKDPPPSFCGRSTATGGQRPWRRTISCAQLQALWQPHAQRYGPLQRLALGPRGPGGRLTALALEGVHGTLVVRRELPIRQFLGGLPSAAFVLQTQGLPPCAPSDTLHEAQTRLELVGTGWGHGVGLCQRGAMGRARAGHAAGRILAHYYSGASVQRLWSVEPAAPGHAPKGHAALKAPTPGPDVLPRLESLL